MTTNIFILTKQMPKEYDWPNLVVYTCACGTLAEATEQVIQRELHQMQGWEPIWETTTLRGGGVLISARGRYCTWHLQGVELY